MALARKIRYKGSSVKKPSDAAFSNCNRVGLDEPNQRPRRSQAVLQLPLDHPEPFAATMGTMLYPGTGESERRKAATFTSGYLAQPLEEYYRRGGRLSEDQLRRIITSGGALIDDLQDRWWAGQATGEITKVLIALHNSDPALASWKSATSIVEQETGSARGTGRSALMNYRRQFGSVSHLWAAWQLRGGRFAADELSGNSLAVDFQRFICEAERIRLWGQGFVPERAMAEPVFGPNMWAAPADWLAPLPYEQWPGEGWLPPIEAMAGQLQGLRPPGRPRKQ
ncbi:hypothetical protein [Minwuia sp. IMCC3060]|uniref:hypothetical protein n=1 Tax=Minwuia sp. IMCC3060 TaxID=3040675 RepID=UPI00247941B0|nr:hypothetical protein [Minwuia sp. IMCC3060]